MQLVLGWDCPELAVAIRLVFADEEWTAIRPNESYLWEEVRFQLIVPITHRVDEHDHAPVAGLSLEFCDCGNEPECPQLARPRELLLAVRHAMTEFRKALLMRDYDNIAQAIMRSVPLLPVLTLPLPGARPAESTPDYPDVELPC